MPRHFAIVPAAGSGSRFGAEKPKQYLSLLGRPLIHHTLAALVACPDIERVWVVLAPDDAEWRQVRYMIFELPGAPGSFRERAEAMRQIARDANLPWLREIEQFPVVDRNSLQKRLKEVVKAGGEGLMLHRADAPYLTGRSDALLKRLDLWKALKANGFRTAFEMPEPSRSDCHAWAAHPVYHFLATIAGIRPADFGFESVVIRPQPGSLTRITGRMPHRLGNISFDLSREGPALLGTIRLPAGMEGTLILGSKRHKLKPGINKVAPAGKTGGRAQKQRA